MAGVHWLGSLGGALERRQPESTTRAVVGLSYTAANLQHAFLWTEASGMQDLTPSLTNVGGATAMGINSTNQVVGYYYPEWSHKRVGFIWTQARRLRRISARSGTLALAINDSGTVVGQCSHRNGYKHAFSWTAHRRHDRSGHLGWRHKLRARHQQ